MEKENAKRAADIVKSLDKIQKLRTDIHCEFDKLRGLMVEDGQPDYELRKLDEIKTLVLKSGHKDLVAEWIAWSGYAVERKRK